jgi:chemotaxis protein methyltransferase CheR
MTTIAGAGARASTSPLEELARQVRDATGNLVHASRLCLLDEAATRRARVLGFASLSGYVQALADGRMAEEWGFLVSLVTIKESYFFRAPQQFEAIVQEVLPQLLRARGRERRLRFWSAAAARGEEPATLALLLAEERALAGWDWTILATDLDDEALAGARTGLYGERAVAQVPAALRERYFAPRGKLFELSAGLRERIVYQPLNLARPTTTLPGAPFDLILLRNVLIYFRRSLQRRVVGVAARLLAPDGYLFLGATETLWPTQGELAAVDLGPCFVYRHAAAAEARPAAGKPAAAGALPAREPPPRAGEGKAAGLALVPASAAPEPAPASVTDGGSSTAGGVDSVDSVDGAVALLAADRLAEAEAALAALVERTPSEPAVHALHGFLLDVQGRDDGAIAAYRAALYLDPALFQVRLLLAERLLRGGERDAAKRHFREVLTWLEGGREHKLEAFSELPVAQRERAERRCRQALGGR